MEDIYKKLGGLLLEKLNDFYEKGIEISEALQITVTNTNRESLIYGISFAKIRDAYYIIGSCYGGGHEFIELIEDIDIDDLDENYLASTIKTDFITCNIRLIAI